MYQQIFERVREIGAMPPTVLTNPKVAVEVMGLLLAASERIERLERALVTIVDYQIDFAEQGNVIRVIDKATLEVAEEALADKENHERTT